MLVKFPQTRCKAQQQEQQQQPGQLTAVVTPLISGVSDDENEDQTEPTIQKQQQQQQQQHDGVNPVYVDCNCDDVFFSCDTATSIKRLDNHENAGHGSDSRPPNNVVLRPTLLHQATSSSNGLVSFINKYCLR